ncbi:MAG: hypothetical protein HGJ93_00715 [Desulfosarcina sp.]|nr:hypothetical protein [Desulfosarcina sp.]MBC2764508.1 hypothetical protein [Desulfosarcina sp.]
MRIPSLINLPELSTVKNIGGVIRYLMVLKKTIVDRDQQTARAINNNDIEIVTSAPSGAPDYPEPVLRLYKNGATWQLYIYTGATDGWKYVNLT